MHSKVIIKNRACSREPNNPPGKPVGLEGSPGRGCSRVPNDPPGKPVDSLRMPPACPVDVYARRYRRTLPYSPVMPPACPVDMYARRHSQRRPPSPNATGLPRWMPASLSAMRDLLEILAGDAWKKVLGTTVPITTNSARSSRPRRSGAKRPAASGCPPPTPWFGFPLRSSAPGERRNRLPGPHRLRRRRRAGGRRPDPGLAAGADRVLGYPAAAPDSRPVARDCQRPRALPPGRRGRAGQDHRGRADHAGTQASRAGQADAGYRPQGTGDANG